MVYSFVISENKIQIIMSDQNVFVVWTRTSFSPELREEILNLAHRSWPVFSTLPGFISMRAHIGEDQNETMTLLEWESKEHHEACMIDPAWGDMAGEWDRYMQDERVNFEMRIYNKVSL